MILGSLTPHVFRLGLHAALGAEQSHGAVENAQAALHFHGEVDVSGGVYQVDAVRLALLVHPPLRGGGCGSYGYTALRLLFHPVHSRLTFVHFAYLVHKSGVVQYSFAGGGLTGVNVSHDADISYFVKCKFSSHMFILNN